MKNIKRILSILAIIILVGIFVISFSKNIFNLENSEQDKNIEELAKCLANKNIIEYGKWWCEACNKQKELFGKSFKYLKYVECSKNTQECLDKNIKYTPTWFFPNGEKIIGLTPLETLAQKSGCKLPANNE